MIFMINKLPSVKKIIFFLGVLFVFFPWHFTSAKTAHLTTYKYEVKSPYIINKSGLVYYYPGKIIGLTPSNTEVLVYLDGSFVGNAIVQGQGTVTDNFYFQLPKQLKPGKHKIFTIAKDKTSLVLSPNSKELEFTIKSVPAPTLIKPDKRTITSHPKPYVTGLTANNTKVLIYIDGIYNGFIPAVNDKSGVANFAYRPFLNLSIGKHKAWAIAVDLFGNKSKISNILTFNIEPELPAPTLFQPIINKNTTFNRPFIVGLTKNNLTVKIFIDKKLNGEFKVKNHPSGTTDFAYLPFLPLSAGRHMIYAVDVDSRGKESRWSNIIYFDVSYPKNISTDAKISSHAVSEERKLPDNVNKLLLLGKLYKINKNIEINDEQFADLKEIIDNLDNYNLSKDEISTLKQLSLLKKEETKLNNKEESEKVDSDLNQFINSTSSEEQQESGLINEKKEDQGKIKSNLIIFILFLFAIIVWIFWVNRELIKEKEEEQKKKE